MKSAARRKSDSTFQTSGDHPTLVDATLRSENDMKNRKKCMANGGVYPKERSTQEAQEPEWQKSLKTAWDAITGNEAPPAARTKNLAALSGPRDAIVERKKKNLDALNYAKGGVIPVKGRGTTTSDSIPVVVAGREVGLSDGEGIATLPAKTMKTPGAIDAIESIIQATNDGKPPVPTKAGGRAAGGVDDLEKKKVVPAGDKGAIKRDGNSFSMAPAPAAAAKPQTASIADNSYDYASRGQMAPGPSVGSVWPKLKDAFFVQQRRGGREARSCGNCGRPAKDARLFRCGRPQDGRAELSRAAG